MLRKIGFGERFIDMIYRLLNNNWYSLLINGQPRGFFKSSRGLKQGDPLSPTLFIIAAEVLSRSLNKLLNLRELKTFGMLRGSPKLNHLVFVDDMIILCKAEMRTMQLVADVLRKYENTLGQKVNKDKNTIYMHHNVQHRDVVVAEVALGIKRKDFPFNYLGCPIFYKRKQKLFYQQLINRISSKLQGWKRKLLSYGGRAILIKHVLQSIPIYCL